MRKRKRSPACRSVAPTYPSLGEHCAARRRFLTTAGVTVGSGVLWAACGRPFGIGGEREQEPMPGAVEEPGYHVIRIPAEPGDRATYLIDGGYARFYAQAVTYHLDCASFATDAREDLADRFSRELAERTYDELASAAGLQAVEGRLRELLDEAYNQDTGDSGSDWFADVELIFVRLDAPEPIGGLAGPEPEYP